MSCQPHPSPLAPAYPDIASRLSQICQEEIALGLVLLAAVTPCLPLTTMIDEALPGATVLTATHTAMAIARGVQGVAHRRRITMKIAEEDIDRHPGVPWMTILAADTTTLTDVTSRRHLTLIAMGVHTIGRRGTSLPG